MRKRFFIFNAFLCTAGVFFIGAGIGCERYADLGLDPFMTLVTGAFIRVFRPLGVGFGAGYVIFCAAILLFSVFFDRTKIGFGTLVNMTLTGYASELIVFALRLMKSEPSLIFRSFVLAGGIALIGFGAGIYLNTHLGTSPYDAPSLILAEKLRPSWYRWFRMGTDGVCVGLGFLLGCIPGAGTLVMVLFTGPLVAFFIGLFQKTVLFRRRY
ncbi:MAG: hypothetical protein LBD07_00900 [Spirochaetaceae bacterium]|jgi:uncharacterized membrane protein YczE|nr:hypothetical protein [Spirochaetaceae bacterium]